MKKKFHLSVLFALAVLEAVAAGKESRPPALPDASSPGDAVRALTAELDGLTRSAGAVKQSQDEVILDCGKVVQSLSMVNAEQADHDQRWDDNKKELAQVAQEKADCACRMRTLSQNMKKACQELARLEKARAELNAWAGQLNADGKKPMTADKKAAHLRNFAKQRSEAIKNKEGINKQCVIIDVLLPQGEACRDRGTRLATREAKLHETRRNLIEEAAKLDGRRSAQRGKGKELRNRAPALRNEADSLRGQIEQTTRQADARLAELRARNKGPAKGWVQKQIDALSRAADDARKAHEELRAMQGKMGKAIEQVNTSLRAGKP